ncbi:MAG: 50S ribosomal protein L3 N(5)-glutamine methyltransferase [Alphaproteobacteria bacterium]|nr:50S ribosomal protein L3 N(5)-glutamine methyltransferase [Alphaproteobacteria bacterium]
MNLHTFIYAAAQRLEQAQLVYGHGTDNAFDEAAFIALETLGLPPDTNFESGISLSPHQSEKIMAVIEARITTRKPAPYLLQKAYIQGIPFYVDERVIVPRSFIAELLLDEYGFAPPGMPEHPKRILDLCTGSGCLAIIAALLYPEAAVDAVDLSSDALAVAQLNLKDHDLAGRITLFQGDGFAPLAGKTYDLIITNPPYVDAPAMAALPPEYRHEPAMALGSGTDGLDLVRRILDHAPTYLTADGGIVCEIGRGQDILERDYPQLPFLWLETENSSGEVFWLTRKQLVTATH